MIRIHSLKDIPDEIRKIIENFYMQDEGKARQAAKDLRHEKPELSDIIHDVLTIFDDAPNGISMCYEKLVELQRDEDERPKSQSMLDAAATKTKTPTQPTESDVVKRLASISIDLDAPEPMTTPKKSEPKLTPEQPKFNVFDIFPSDSKVPATKMSLFDESSVKNSFAEKKPLTPTQEKNPAPRVMPFSLLDNPALASQQDPKPNKNSNPIVNSEKNAPQDDFNLFDDDDIDLSKDNDFNLFDDDDIDLPKDNAINLFDDDDIDLSKDNDFNLFDDDDNGFKLFDNEDAEVESPKMELPPIEKKEIPKSGSYKKPSKPSIDNMPLFLTDDMPEPADLDVSADLDMPETHEDGYNLDIELDFDMDVPGMDISGLLDAPDIDEEDIVQPPKKDEKTPPPSRAQQIEKTPLPHRLNTSQQKDEKTPLPHKTSTAEQKSEEAQPLWFTKQNLGNSERVSQSSSEAKPTAEALPPVQEISAMRGRPAITFGSTVSQRPDVDENSNSPASKATQLSQNSGLLLPPVGGAGLHKAAPTPENFKPTAAQLTPISARPNYVRPTMVSSHAISGGFSGERDIERENLALENLKPLTRIARLRVPLADLSRRSDINPRAGFILSNVDGITSIRDLLDISAFPEPQTALLLAELEEQGIIAFR